MKNNKPQDVLIGRRAQINEGFPFAGRRGTISRALKGGTYEIEIPGEPGEGLALHLYTYALSDFTVLHDEVAADVPSTLVQADPHLVAFSLNNPRRRRGLDVESIAGLASSIKAQGLAQPILVRPLPGHRADDTFRDREEGRPLPTYELVCGERRLRASRIAGMPTIPMMLRELSDEQALELQLVENIEREDLDPIEEAEGFKLLQDKLGYTAEQIAERIGRGKSKDYVYKTMKLLQLTPESREAVYDGHLGRSTGLIVARYPAEQQAEVVAFIKSLAVRGEPAPFRDVAPKVFTRFNLDLRKVVWLTTDATLVEAAGACTDCSKRTGATSDLFGDDGENPDSCTDADCFEGKRRAHVERAKAEAKKQGLQVVEDDKARQAFPSPYTHYPHGYTPVTYVVDEIEGDDGTERAVTFEDALRAKGKKAPKPLLLVNPHTGAALKVITNELAEQLTNEIDAKKGGTASASAGGSRSAPRHVDERPDELKALDNRHVRLAVLFRIFDAVRNRDRTDAEVLLITKALFAANEDGYQEHTARYLNWEADLDNVDYGDIPGIVSAKLDALPASDVAAIATMASIEIAAQVFSADWSAQVQLATAYGVDVLAVRDKVEEDMAPKSSQAGEEDGTADEEEADAEEQPTGASLAGQLDPHAAWPYPIAEA